MFLWYILVRWLRAPCNDALYLVGNRLTAVLEQLIYATLPNIICSHSF